MEQVLFNDLNDVKTFGQSIDFMHSALFMSIEGDEETSESESGQVKSKQLKRRSKKTNESAKPTLIGEDLLSEIELFRKTYIILYTHLDDCAKQMRRLYTKYVRKFIQASREAMSLAPSEPINASIDLMISIAVENTVVGYAFAKLWPCLLQLNMREDDLIQQRCEQLRKILKLDCGGGGGTTANSILTNETIELCAKFFRIEKKYFLINIQPVLGEFKRLSLLNNPFEKIECIKTSVDLVTNELAILSSTHKSKEKTAKASNETGQSIITSDTLIPLISFILLRSNINCFKSICFFIDKFQFSAQSNKYSVSHCSTRLDELAFLMTTFKVAIQFIEASY